MTPILFKLVVLLCLDTTGCHLLREGGGLSSAECRLARLHVLTTKVEVPASLAKGSEVWVEAYCTDDVLIPGPLPPL